MVCCQVCTKIEGKEKLLVSKLDSLIKHFSKKKVKKPILGHVMGEYYLKPRFYPCEDQEDLYNMIGKDNIIKQMHHGIKLRRKK